MGASQSNTIVSYSIFSGLIKIGKYTGNGSSQTINCNFKPNVVMIVTTSPQGVINVFAATDSDTSVMGYRVWGGNPSPASSEYCTDEIQITSSGFYLPSGNAKTNYLGSFYYYIAFKTGG